MEGEVEAVLAGKKSSFPADVEEKDAMASAMASHPPAVIFSFLAPPLSLLRHVACLCAGYLGLGGGGLKPPAPAPASLSSTSAAAAAACQVDEVEAAASEDCTEVEVVLEVRSRGGGRGAKPPKKPTFKPPRKTRELPVQSQKGGSGGETSP